MEKILDGEGIHKNDYDLVILDLMLPDGSGFDIRINAVLRRSDSTRVRLRN